MWIPFKMIVEIYNSPIAEIHEIHAFREVCKIHINIWISPFKFYIMDFIISSIFVWYDLIMSLREKI